MTEEHIGPDEGLQPAEGAGAPLSEGEAEAAKGRCGPNVPRHKKAPKCKVCYNHRNPNPVDETSQVCTCGTDKSGCGSSPTFVLVTEMFDWKRG